MTDEKDTQEELECKKQTKENENEKKIIRENVNLTHTRLN